MGRTPHRRVVLDMDISEPVHGERERAACRGHFDSVCHHPLFVFNEFGDCEGAMLRPGTTRYNNVTTPVSPAQGVGSTQIGNPGLR